MRSLIIHNVSTVDLKYLPLIADIVTGDIDEYEDNDDIFEAATWFIQSLMADHYDIDSDEGIKAVTRFIEVAEDLIKKLKEQLSSPSQPQHPGHTQAANDDR